MLEYFGKSMYNNNYLYSCKNGTLNLNWEKFSDLAFIHFFHSINNTYWSQSGSTVQQINLLNNFRKVKSLEKTFYNCHNLHTLETPNGNTSNIVSLADAFTYCGNLKNLDVSNGNTSNLKNLSNTFFYCNQLTNLDVSNGNTSNFTDLSNTYRFCKNLKTLDISNGDTGNIINLSGTFFGCENLTNLDVSNGDINNVTNLSGIFYNCFRLNNLNVSQGNIKNVTNLWGTFYNCYNLTNLDVSNGDVSNVTNLSGVFYNCRNLKILNISNGNTSSVDGLNTAFDNCVNLNTLDVSNGDISNVRNLSFTFYNCYNLKELDVSNGDMSNVGDLSYAFIYCYNLNTLDVSNGDISNVNSLNDTFAYCNRLRNLDVSNGNTSKVTNLYSTFSNCFNLTTLNLSNGDVSNVNDFGYTFAYCRNLTTLDVSNGKLNNAKSLFGTFGGMTHLQLGDSESYDENYNPQLKTFNLTNGNTSNVIFMRSTFENVVGDPYFYEEEYNTFDDPCYDKTSLITFYNGNFTNVINMANFLSNAQFSDCIFPTNTTINGNTTGKVEDLSYAFAFNSKCHYGNSAIWVGGSTESNFYINTCNVTNLKYAFASNGYYIDSGKSGQYMDSYGGEHIHLILTDTSCVLNANNAFAKKTPFNGLSVDGQDGFGLLNSGYQYTVIQPTFYFYNTDILNLYNVTDAGNMFFNYLDNIPKITLYNVTQLNYAFASNYNADLSYYDPVHTKSILKNTFLNQPGDTTNGNLSKVTTMYRTFADRQFSNQDLKNIANALLTAVNVTSTYKNLNISNTSSPFYNAGTGINTATVGSDIASQLSAAGGIIPN